MRRKFFRDPNSVMQPTESAPSVRAPWTRSLMLAAAVLLTVIAIDRTPPPGLSAADGLAGYPRLVLFALAGTLLALTASSRFGLNQAANVESTESDLGRERRLLAFERGLIVLGVGVLLSIGMGAWNVIRLRGEIEDSLGHGLWIGSMVALLIVSGVPAVDNLGWFRRWPTKDAPGTTALARDRQFWPRWFLLITLLMIVVAARFPGLGELPIGIQADEGDRANWALLVLTGRAPPSWFADGWYLINLVYFRLLAGGMSIFGTSVAGTRTLSAIAGTAFVGVVAWIGCRHFSWRTGLLATALASTGALFVQESRFIGESGITALLSAIALAGFLEGGRTGRVWAWVVAGLAGGLALYFYPSGRLWVVGAALVLLVLFLSQPRATRLPFIRGGFITAVAALLAAAPFLVHLETSPAELTERYQETAVLNPINQPRLSYLNPPVPMAELLALQLERTLGMFDRYEDGVSFLPTSRPALPEPIGAITIVGIAYVAARSFRDPRFAIVAAWYGLGIAGVFLTVETPDFLRASGALVTFPLMAALVLTDVADRCGEIFGMVGVIRARLPPVVGYWSSRVLIFVIALSAMAGQAYLYFKVYPTLMEPSWSYATQEGLQIKRLGELGPVFGLDMFAFHVDSGWVRFLAQNVLIDQAPNPGDRLPVIYSESSSPTDAASSLRSRPEQSLSFVLYPDPNQAAYAGLLAALYPDGRLEPPIDGRTAFVVPAAAVGRTLGATAIAAGQAPTVVPALGTLPPGFGGSAAVEWHAGIRLPDSGRYRFRFSSTAAAQLEIDGMTVVTTAGGPPRDIEIVGARGNHFIRLTTTSPGANERISVARTGELAGPNGKLYHELGRAELFSPMDGTWGLLGHVVRGASESRSAANVATTFVESSIAALDLRRYAPVVGPSSTVVWEGDLIAPVDGSYRFALTADGKTSFDVDGHTVPAPAIRWEDWEENLPGISIQLSAGVHPIKLTLNLTGAERALIRFNWIPPAGAGPASIRRGWSVVPPNALRAPPSIWVP